MQSLTVRSCWLRCWMREPYANIYIHVHVSVCVCVCVTVAAVLFAVLGFHSIGIIKARLMRCMEWHFKLVAAHEHSCERVVNLRANRTKNARAQIVAHTNTYGQVQPKSRQM